MKHIEARTNKVLLLLCGLLFFGLYSQLGGNIWPLLAVAFVGLIGVFVLLAIIEHTVAMAADWFSIDPSKFKHMYIQTLVSSRESYVQYTIARRRVIFGRIYYFAKPGKLVFFETKDGWRLYHPAFKKGVLEVHYLDYDELLTHFGYELVQE